uniref:Cytochrome P450, family 8, subfamily B, polypeptide 2 n=1 Tax=Periophthalmus magnuspinnatus TaxID=409849 RepID=A0A3B4AX00_9GOBI
LSFKQQITLFLACIFGGLYFLGVFRQRRPGEPPLDKGWIPWLGHILEFRRDTAKFIQRMRQKHGDIFTVQLGGVYVTFLQDHLSFKQFIKESRENIYFTTFSKMILRVFGYESAFNYTSINQEIYRQHLTGHRMHMMTESIVRNLQKLMLHNLGSAAKQKTWTEGELFNYCCNIVFRAGYLTLFGNASSKTEGDEEKANTKDRIESEALLHEFHKYDQLFPDLVYGVLPPSGRKEAFRLKSHFWDALSMKKIKSKDNISGWIWDMYNVRRQRGMSESMLNRLMFVLLFASQSNTRPVSFWLLLYLMKDPIAMEALKKEVDMVLKESGQEVQPGGPPVNVTYEMLMKTPVLDSAVEETLRLVAAPILTRSVLQDMTLKMADGREFFIRKGDRMSVFPYVAIHVDPEIHPDPYTFKYDRFLTPEGTKKTDFYQGGKKVEYYSMPWGYGVSKCPGRFFAINEIKLFVFLMFVYFDFELINSGEKIPQINLTRWGLGAMQPDTDVKFHYRLRH